MIDQVTKDERFFSTRNTLSDAEKTERKQDYFYDVVRRGLCKDRGLFFPMYIPTISLAQLERLVPMSYSERYDLLATPDIFS